MLGCPDLNVSDACFKAYFFFFFHHPFGYFSDLSVLPWEDKLCVYDCGHDSGRGNRQIAGGSRLGRKLAFLPTIGCDTAHSVTCRTIQGTSLVLQCLRLQAPSLGARVQSLVRNLGPPAPPVLKLKMILPASTNKDGGSRNLRPCVRQHGSMCYS